MGNKNKHKKILVILLTVVLLLTVAACAETEDDKPFAFEINDVREPVIEQIIEQEKESNHILDAAVLGLWNDARTNGGSYSPRKSYDNKKASRWNPAACVGYLGDPAIVYLLDGYYDMDAWEMIYTAREYFFDLYVSKDGKDFRLLQSVTKENYQEFYVTDGDKFIFTLDTPDAKDIAFIKVLFTGSNHVNNSNWVSLNAVKCIGQRLGDGPEELPEFDDPYKITPMELRSYELTGTWLTDQKNVSDFAPEKSFDGNIYSGWNPGAPGRFAGSPGIIYRLADAQDIGKIEFYFGKYKHYFDVYVSTGGNYKQIASISFANEAQAYTMDKNGAYICTLDGLNLKDIEYIKLIFTGRDDGGFWVVLNEVILHEIGTEGVSTSWMMRKEPLSNHPWIAGSKLIGKWNNDRQKDLKWSRYSSYDKDPETFWNPEAMPNFAEEPGIVFTLKKSMNLKKMELNFGKNVHYFNVFVSEDGAEYTQIARICADNEDQAYAAEKALCTLDGLALENIKYVKLVFTGRQNGNPWVSLYEVSLSEDGASDLDTSWMMPAVFEHPTILSGEPVGAWQNNQEGTANSLLASFDSSVSTMWNPGAQSGFPGDPGAVYTLKKAVNIKKMQFDFGTNIYYFDVFVSTDGTAYTHIAEIDADNESKAYTTGTGLCTLDGLSLENVQYVKLIFRARKTGLPWVTLYDVVLSEEGTDGLDISWMLPENSGSGEEEPENPDGGNVGITSANLTGQWANAQEGTSYGPASSYDGNTATFWNPGANGGYAGKPGVVYTLANWYDLTKLQMTFAVRYFYFDVAVSADGSTYTSIASVTADNYATYYTDGYVCTIDGLTAQYVKYIKITFTGDSQNRCWVSFNEFDAVGEVSQGEPEIPDTPEDPEKPKIPTIISGTPVGTWVMDRVGSASVPPEASFDGSITTMWNPQAETGYPGEPGIVYTLDGTYDITRLQLVHKHRHYYYTVAVSADGESYETVATVDATTAPGYYSADNICTLALDAKNVKYIKLTFTGNAQAGNVYAALYNIAVEGTVAGQQPELPPQPETIQVTIVDGTPIGTWVLDRIGSASVPPQFAYDSSLTTMWNPQASSIAYNAGEGIVFTLDKAYDIKKFSLTFKRNHYYKILVSEDGINYTELSNINAENAASYYTVVDAATEVVRCDLDVTAINVKYIKLMFAGNVRGNDFVALYDIAVFGIVDEEGERNDG